MKIQVHSFKLGDVEDPEIYAAGPLYDWEKSEPGSWVMYNSLTPPTYYIGGDPYHWGYVVRVMADLTPEDTTYFSLKWGDY